MACAPERGLWCDSDKCLSVDSVAGRADCLALASGDSWPGGSKSLKARHSIPHPLTRLLWESDENEILFEERLIDTKEGLIAQFHLQMPFLSIREMNRMENIVPPCLFPLLKGFKHSP